MGAIGSCLSGSKVRGEVGVKNMTIGVDFAFNKTGDVQKAQNLLQAAANREKYDPETQRKIDQEMLNLQERLGQYNQTQLRRQG